MQGGAPQSAEWCQATLRKERRIGPIAGHAPEQDSITLRHLPADWCSAARSAGAGGRVPGNRLTQDSGWRTDFSQCAAVERQTGGSSRPAV